MRIILIINILLGLGLIAVITGTLSMIAYSGYNDQMSMVCFVVHSLNGILLLFREVLK